MKYKDKYNIEKPWVKPDYSDKMKERLTEEEMWRIIKEYGKE